MALQGGLLAFANNPVPQEQDSYRSGALTLKVFGWVALAGTILMVLALLVMGLFMMLFGAWFSEVAGGWDFGFGGFLGAMMMFAMLIGALIALAIGIGAVAWTSWIFLRYLERDARALNHMLILGIILLVLGGLGLLGAMSGPMMGTMSTMDSQFTGFGFNFPLPAIAEVVFGVLFVVFASKDDVKAAFGVGGPQDTVQAAPPQ